MPCGIIFRYDLNLARFLPIFQFGFLRDYRNHFVHRCRRGKTTLSAWALLSFPVTGPAFVPKNPFILPNDFIFSEKMTSGGYAWKISIRRVPRGWGASLVKHTAFFTSTSVPWDGHCKPAEIINFAIVKIWKQPPWVRIDRFLFFEKNFPDFNAAALCWCSQRI